MKSVVLEKQEIQNRGEPISQAYLEIVVDKDSDAEKELIVFRPMFLKK